MLERPSSSHPTTKVVTLIRTHSLVLPTVQPVKVFLSRVHTHESMVVRKVPVEKYVEVPVIKVKHVPVYSYKPVLNSRWVQRLVPSKYTHKWKAHTQLEQYWGVQKIVSQKVVKTTSTKFERVAGWDMAVVPVPVVEETFGYVIRDRHVLRKILVHEVVKRKVPMSSAAGVESVRQDSSSVSGAPPPPPPPPLQVSSGGTPFSANDESRTPDTSSPHPHIIGGSTETNSRPCSSADVPTSSQHATASGSESQMRAKHLQITIESPHSSQDHASATSATAARDIASLHEVEVPQEGRPSHLSPSHGSHFTDGHGIQSTQSVYPNSRATAMVRETPRAAGPTPRLVSRNVFSFDPTQADRYNPAGPRSTYSQSGGPKSPLSAMTPVGKDLQQFIRQSGPSAFMRRGSEVAGPGEVLRELSTLPMGQPPLSSSSPALSAASAPPLPMSYGSTTALPPYDDSTASAQPIRTIREGQRRPSTIAEDTWQDSYLDRTTTPRSPHRLNKQA